MLYGYFAVSGDQGESAICCLSGFIAEADEWNSVDRAWRTVLAHVGSNFDAIACLCGKDIFQSWDIPRRHALLADLSGVLARSALIPMGAFTVREHFSGLSSTDHAVLMSEGIESPLDLVFYDLTERLIRRVHEESEKISLLLEQEPRSAAEQYNKLFNKHLGRYLLGTHLMGALAFADARGCSQLQAAKLLAETVRLVETQKLFPEKIRTRLPESPALRQMAESPRDQRRFGTAELHALIEKLKSIKSKQERRS